MNTIRSGTRRHLLIGYSCSILLVLAYLNMFPVVRYIVKTWGTTPVLVLPILITISALIAISLLLLRARRVRRVQPDIAPIMIGTAICLAALFIPDPEAPIKRIHVIEYMILSLLIRYTMSIRLQGASLLVYSIFFTSLLGVHDELLQGLHPLRTYGTRDILVNAVASAGGGFIWHGFRLFEHSTQASEPVVRLTPRSSSYLVWLFCSVLFFFMPLLSFRQA
ncbi:MAG: VanZ family protein, partial [Desulfocapsaceae bacterium]|nr:VanZ family protein [Desulfocapsaceae bacterium]